MPNADRVLEVARCSRQQVMECTHPMSKRLWGEQYVCDVLRPIDCPKLICPLISGPCLFGAAVNTNNERVEFPCSKCNPPTQEQRQTLMKQFKNDALK